MNLALEVLPERRWAEAIADAWSQRLGSNPVLRMCLPTGATPRPVYRMMEAADFSRSTVFVLDEFGLPDGDPARCDAMLRRDLLDRLRHQPATVERLDPTLPDGHLGLNEPGSTPDLETRRVELTDATRTGLDRYGAESATGWGLTLGLKEILDSREIWLLVRGEHKATVLEATLRDPVGSGFPATFLRDAPNVVVWADEPAAALL